jgi:hypothetical protein
MKAKILGMKASKGVMDNGQAFDSTKIYVETRLDESKGSVIGIFCRTKYQLRRLPRSCVFGDVFHD